MSTLKSLMEQLELELKEVGEALSVSENLVRKIDDAGSKIIEKLYYIRDIDFAEELNILLKKCFSLEKGMWLLENYLSILNKLKEIQCDIKLLSNSLLEKNSSKKRRKSINEDEVYFNATL